MYTVLVSVHDKSGLGSLIGMLILSEFSECHFIRYFKNILCIYYVMLHLAVRLFEYEIRQSYRISP